MFHKLEVWADVTANISSLDKTNLTTLPLGNEEKHGGVALVLGAGNQSFITMMDVLQCIFYHPCKPVLIKHHPLRPHLVDVCSELFAPLIECGFLDQICDGGIEETQTILKHPDIAHVHVTGALSTARAIENKLAESRSHISRQDVERMVTSELGCATPWIIAPGDYSLRELNMAAKHIMTGKKVNAGCNCLCSQVVILPHEWDQKDEFKRILLEKAREIPTDPLYYPGSFDRVQSFAEKYDSTKVQQILSRTVDRNFDGDSSDFVPIYVIDCGVYGKEDFNSYALENEAFGPILALVELPGNVNQENYLMDCAVPFVNQKGNIYGSLSCSLVYPKKINTDIIKKVIAALNYGCVALNTWSFFGYFGIGYGGSWGGCELDETGQSGRGLIGNYFLIPGIQKTVVYSRALTFPLLVDKNFIPPKILMDLVSRFFLRRNLLTSIKKMIWRQ